MSFKQNSELRKPNAKDVSTATERKFNHVRNPLGLSSTVVYLAVNLMSLLLNLLYPVMSIADSLRLVFLSMAAISLCPDCTVVKNVPSSTS